VLLDLDLGLPLHVFGHSRPGHFALEPPEQKFQPLADVEALEDFVAVGDLEIEI